MQPEIPQHIIFPISDNGITVDFGNIISEDLNTRVLALFDEFQKRPLEGMIETVPAYSSLTIYYDLFRLKKSIGSDTLVYDWVTQQLEDRMRSVSEQPSNAGKVFQIPVCYDAEFGPELMKLASDKNLSVEEVIHIHSSRQYRVYMLGFLPGFCYMGEVDERIAMPRKMQPVPVEPGSIGIAGRQTGIYPAASPGGWNIIGRTHLTTFEKDKEQPTLLSAGDKVQFIPISKDEFKSH